MVKYCVANECPIDERRVQMLPKTVISSASNTYTKKSKRLGIWNCLLGGSNGHLHILEYLVERKYDKFDEYACAYAAENGHLRLFEVLTRNRQSALGLSGRTIRAQNNQTDCVQYLLDNNCPLPEDWSYEDGQLRAA